VEEEVRSLRMAEEKKKTKTLRTNNIINSINNNQALGTRKAKANRFFFFCIGRRLWRIL
jgi:hypothetical protein